MTRILFLLISALFAIPCIAQQDMTGLVSKTDWVGSSGDYTAGGVSGSVTGRELYQPSALPVGVLMSQTVEVPNGIYAVELYAMASSTVHRDGGCTWISPNGGDEFVSLHVGDQVCRIPAYNRVNSSTFEIYSFPCVIVQDGRLTMSMHNDIPSANWVVMQIKSLTYLGDVDLVGDVNGDKKQDVGDVTALVDIILGKGTDTHGKANVDGKGTIDVADVTTLVDIILGKSSHEALVAGQLMVEQTSQEGCVISQVCDDQDFAKASNVDIDNYLTKLDIVTTLPNVTRVSVFAKDKTPIAGHFLYGTRAGAWRFMGDACTYHDARRSDVVSVVEAYEGKYTARLLPADLAQGVTITVQCSDGQFYSQDFADIRVGETQTLQFTSTTATNAWMATIPGDTYISMISTPSAHDAATSGCTTLTYVTKCQTEDIPTLLARGVRAFDLRPGFYNNKTITPDNLYIYHGMISTNVKYADAIKAFVDFLKANPSEMISVIMTKENNKPVVGGTDYSTEMYNSISAIHDQYASYFKVLDHSYYTLDDYRGKICYVHRNNWDISGTVRITNWIDDGSSTDYSSRIGDVCYANVQDAYNASDDDKKVAFTAMLDYSSNNTERSRFHYNYTSIAGAALKALTDHCKVMNPFAANYLDAGNIAGPTGFVYADYIASSQHNGIDLKNAVINQNYRYIFQGRSVK